MLLEYYRVRASAHPPTRANPSDAGLDVFFNPENATKKGLFISLSRLLVKKYRRKVIPANLS